MPRGNSASSTSEETSSSYETDTTDDDKGQGGYGMMGRYQPPGMGPGMFHPHHHHHHHHHPMGMMMGGGGGLESDITGETNSTELAARERARTLLLEFRETKMNLTNTTKALEDAQAENKRLNQVLYQQRMLFSQERTEFNTSREAWQRDKENMSLSIPEPAKKEMEGLSASLITCSREKVQIEEELRISGIELNEMERKYLSQESEIQVLREAVQVERERTENVLHPNTVISAPPAETSLHDKNVIEELRNEIKSLKESLRGQQSMMHTPQREPPIIQTVPIAMPVSPQAPAADYETLNHLNGEILYLRNQLHHYENQQGGSSGRGAIDNLMAKSEEAERYKQELHEKSAELERVIRDVRNHDSDIERSRDELRDAQDRIKQLQSIAAANRLHKQADDSGLFRANEKLRTDLQQSNDQTSSLKKQCAREERRHTSTRQKLESIIKEQDKVLTAIESLKDERKEARSEIKKLKKAEETNKTERSIITDELRSVKQQLLSYQLRNREHEQIRLETERQRDGLGIAVRHATDDNLHIDRERQRLQQNLQDQQSLFTRERQALETELHQRGAEKQKEQQQRLEQERARLSLEAKCEDLQLQVSSLTQYQLAPPEPVTPHKSLQSTVAPSSSTGDKGSDAATRVYVQSLAAQLTTKDRELHDLRSDMDALRLLVEHQTPTGRSHQPPSTSGSHRSGPL